MFSLNKTKLQQLLRVTTKMKVKITFYIFILVSVKTLSAEKFGDSMGIFEDAPQSPKKEKPMKIVCEELHCTIKYLHSNDYFKLTKSKDIIAAKHAHSLDFKFSTLDHIPLGLDRMFPKLRTLDVSNLGLTKIRKTDLQHYPKLKEFIARNNKITYIPQDLFEANKMVKEIDFTGNQIKVLKILSIRNLNKLKVLDLSGNECIGARFEKLNAADTTQREKNMNLILKKCKEKKKKASEAP